MRSPEGGPSQEQSGSRPSDQDIDDVVENQMMNRRMSPMGYETTKNQFHGWAEGENDEAREEYYPGWTDEDFEKLLKKLEEREENG